MNSLDNRGNTQLSLFDILGRKSKTRTRGEIVAENQRKGKAAERQFVALQRYWHGNKIERTGHGSDYRVTETDRWTGKKKTYLYEVKSGKKGKLSPLQEKTKKKTRNYRVKHVNPVLY